VELSHRVYVMLDIYQLQNQFLSLRERTRSLRASKTKVGVKTTEAEGYELQEKPTTPKSSDIEVSDQQVDLKKEWRTWQLASLKNVYVHLALSSEPLDPRDPLMV
jgi:lipid II:glycine glycyltransferase (peptidoglycan interpeptide bridge formation enzyme)